MLLPALDLTDIAARVAFSLSPPVAYAIALWAAKPPGPIGGFPSLTYERSRGFDLVGMNFGDFGTVTRFSLLVLDSYIAKRSCMTLKSAAVLSSPIIGLKLYSGSGAFLGFLF